jgi:hypothetical protein
MFYSGGIFIISEYEVLYLGMKYCSQIVS